MKLSLAALALLIPHAILAQQVTYLDENHKPATAASYKYKRVIKYKGPEMNLNLGVGYYGGLTTRPTDTGIQTCSLTDYYLNGAPALMGNIISWTKDCKEFLFHGQVVAYYPDGHLQEKVFYKAGKPQGDVITYNPDGSIKHTDHYENGVRIDTKQFAVAPSNPMLGTWKSVIYASSPARGLHPSVSETVTVAFSENGTLDSTSVSMGGSRRSSAKANWKYLSKSPTAGILEEYLGATLTARGDITWLNHNKLEYVCTFFAQDANKVGTHLTYDRQ